MLKPWLRITRLPLAPTAVCDVVACTLLAVAVTDGAHVELATWLQVGAVSLLIYAFGMTLNDLADREVDRFKDPSRPLPSGDLSQGPVAIAVVLFALGALALAQNVGVFWCALTAIGFATLYDTTLKRRLVPGAVALGMVRASNASLVAWYYVIHLDAPWTLLLAPACIGLYSAAVVVLSTTEDVDRPERVWWARGMAATAFVGAALLAWLLGGQPTLGLGVAFGITTSTLFGRTPKPGPPKKMVLEMLLGLYWLAAVIAGGWHDGTIQGAVISSFVALVIAWALAIGTQLMIRWLRKKPAPTASSERATPP